MTNAASIDVGALIEGQKFGRFQTGLMFAHDNAVENLVTFAPLVLILSAIDYSTQWTVMACAVYFWARVAHLLVYTLGLPVFRTLAFAVGFAAQAVLALAIFKLV